MKDIMSISVKSADSTGKPHHADNAVQKGYGKMEREELGTKVYRIIRKLIVEGEFAPGSRLNVEELCRRLGSGRTPTWVAINKLEAEGLVETVPRRGVYVLNFSVEKVIEVYAVREALDGLAARMAASRITKAQEQKLDKIVTHMEEAATIGEFNAYYRADVHFHNQILQIIGNQTLRRFLEGIYGQIRILRAQSVTLPEHMVKRTQEHRAICDAIKAKEPERAERVAREHVQSVLADAIKIRNEAKVS